MYDNVLFGFRALNELHKRNQSLTSANVLASLRSTTMLGATSEIELDANGERVAAYNLMNYVTQADGKRAWVQVGNVWPTGVELTSTVHWTSGRTSTPVDVPTVRRVPRQVSVAASTTVIVLASFGILVTAIVLAFNVHYRDLTFIKMSSPIFNNVILVGVIVGFVYIIVLGVSNGTNCLVRVALLSFAFSMCFGGLFIKTYRVAAIFNTGAEAKVVKIKNRLLFAYMGALIAIDVVIICVWAIVDPITTLVTNLPSIPDDLDPDNSIVQPYISRCNSVYYDTFLGTIYGVKVQLMDTRGRQWIPIMNAGAGDNHYLGRVPICPYVARYHPGTERLEANWSGDLHDRTDIVEHRSGAGIPQPRAGHRTVHHGVHGRHCRPLRQHRYPVRSEDPGGHQRPAREVNQDTSHHQRLCDQEAHDDAYPSHLAE